MQLDKLVNTLGLDCCDQIPFLQTQARKLQVSRPAYLATLLSLLAIAFIILGIGRGFLIKLLTVIYPLIATIQLLETQDYSQAKQWLSYWIVVTILHLMDDYFYWILYYLPYYQLIRVAFLVALFHPEVQGAEKFYDYVIHKQYVKFQQYIYGNKSRHYAY